MNSVGSHEVVLRGKEGKERVCVDVDVDMDVDVDVGKEGGREGKYSRDVVFLGFFPFFYFAMGFFMCINDYFKEQFLRFIYRCSLCVVGVRVCEMRRNSQCLTRNVCGAV